MTYDFVGERKPLDEFDIPMLAHRLQTGEDELRAFLEVEARSRGYDRSGRPVMLFEPHVFYRNLGDGSARDDAVAAGLAYAKWGDAPYPNDSYPRLLKAIEIDEDAALKACSIGLSQVLVENHSSVGYATPQDMWQAFMDDEQEHVEAMVRFILVNGIADDLKAHRWEVVARVYNGPGYRKHNYHGRMAQAFRKFAGIPDVDWSPDGIESGPGGLNEDELKSIQRKLRELGYVEVGRADGHWGTRTRAGVLAFRADNDLPLIATVDDQFKAALATGNPRSIGESRQQTTAEDLRSEGSRTVKAADNAGAAGAVVAGGGTIVGVVEAISSADANLGVLQGMADKVTPLIDTAKDFGPMILIGVGAFVLWQMYKAREARVDDHRTGKNAGTI